MNKNVNDQKHVNTDTSANYFGYYNPSFLVKDIYEDNEAMNKEIVNVFMIYWLFKEWCQ